MQEEGIAWSIKGKLLGAIEQFDAAKRAHRKSLDMLAEQDRYELGLAHVALAELIIDKEGEVADEARFLLLEALAILEAVGAHKSIQKVKDLL